MLIVTVSPAFSSMSKLFDSAKVPDSFGVTICVIASLLSKTSRSAGGSFVFLGNPAWPEAVGAIRTRTDQVAMPASERTRIEGLLDLWPLPGDSGGRGGRGGGGERWLKKKKSPRKRGT